MVEVNTKLVSLPQGAGSRPFLVLRLPIGLQGRDRHVGEPHRAVPEPTGMDLPGVSSCTYPAGNSGNPYPVGSASTGRDCSRIVVSLRSHARMLCSPCLRMMLDDHKRTGVGSASDEGRAAAVTGTREALWTG